MKINPFLFAALLCFMAQPVWAGGAFYSQPLSAKVLPIGVHLSWSTYRELGVKRFFVEKSSDGINYQEIGQEEGSGFSLVDNQYHFLDMDSDQGRYFYRLREWTNEERISYSFPTTVQIADKRDLRILTLQMNEINAQTTIAYELRTPGVVLGFITNIKGEKIEEFEVGGELGINTLKKDLAEHSPGFYVLHLVKGTSHERFTVWKQTNVASEVRPVASTGKPR